jgi:DMSO/TMAO reductase YedYZ molybdopterin-dependent catalytic subunit/mono/diheme cytochrome c family protein
VGPSSYSHRQWLLWTSLVVSIPAAELLGDSLLIERNARPLLAESTPEALEPWETPLEGFFIRSHHNVFPIKVDDSWTIEFTGLLGKPRKISLKELKRRKSVSFHAVLECSGNGRGLFSPQVSGIQWKRGAVGNAEWTGVPLSTILQELKVKNDAVYVTVEGFDEPVMKSDTKFVRSIPLSMLKDTNAILAWDMNRQSIPIAHGGPVRLVLPGIYGQNWVKWVNKMTFSKTTDERMYAKKAYRMPDKPIKPGEAWDPVKNGKPVEYILTQTIFTTPWAGAKVVPGHVQVRGKAFTGKGHITRVDISLDEGKSWQPTRLSKLKDRAWQEFEFDMTAIEGKTYNLLARATDSSGYSQPLTQEWNPKGYLYNAVDKLEFKADAAGSLLAEGGTLAARHCQTCHSLGIAEGQRLSKQEWLKTAKKMSDYGLVLADADYEKIAAFYADKYPPGTPANDSKTVELSSNPSLFVAPSVMRIGNSAKGQSIFKSHCAACHGNKGEGKVGPVLRARSITDATFWAAVMNGKRTMPAFKGVLNVTQISDVKAWLDSQKP